MTRRGLVADLKARVERFGAGRAPELTEAEIFELKEWLTNYLGAAIALAQDDAKAAKQRGHFERMRGAQ